MVACEPFPRAGVAVVGGECADGQGDGVAERSGMWGGTPNRPAMGPEHLVAGSGRWGTERPAANRWGPDHLVEPDRADAGDGRHALDRDAALTPIFTALRRGRWRRPRGQAGASGLRLAPEPVERRHDGPPTSPIPIVPALHALDPYPTGGYHAASVDPVGSGGFREVDPHASGGFREYTRMRRAASTRSSPMRRADSAGRSSRRPHPVVTGRCPPTCTRGAASLVPREPRAVSSDARQRRVGRSLRPGLVRPARGPAVADGDDGCVVPGGLLDAAPAGDRHGPPPPPSGPGRLVTASRYVCRREWARSPARVGGFVGPSRRVCRRTARLIAICARGAVGAEALQVSDRGCPLLGR